MLFEGAARDILFDACFRLLDYYVGGGGLFVSGVLVLVLVEVLLHQGGVGIGREMNRIMTLQLWLASWLL